MEPISLIITALTAGAVAAAKDTAEKGVKDAYDGLKALIKKRFADKGKADDSNIIDKHEKKPDSEAVKALLKEELVDVEVDKDVEILKVAEEIMKKEDPEGTAAGNYNMNIGRDFKGVAIQEMNDGTINQTIS